MTNYGPKKLWYVRTRSGPPAAGGTAPSFEINYVFESNQLDAVLTDLGCVRITNPNDLKTLETGTLGAYYKAPKNRPRRATQRTASGYNSGFHGEGKVLTGSTWLSGGFGAQAAPLPPPIFEQSDTSKFSVSVFVQWGRIKYAWNMTKVRFNKLSTFLSALGVQECSENDRYEYIWGADAPKPARYVIQMTGTGGDVDSVSSFVASNKYNNGDPIAVGGAGGGTFNLMKPPITLFNYLRNHKSFR